MEIMEKGITIPTINWPLLIDLAFHACLKVRGVEARKKRRVVRCKLSIRDNSPALRSISGPRDTGLGRKKGLSSNR
jgi:hypothetical protein